MFLHFFSNRTCVVYQSVMLIFLLLLLLVSGFYFCGRSNRQTYDLQKNIMSFLIQIRKDSELLPRLRFLSNLT